MRALVIDAGGTHGKVPATGKRAPLHAGVRRRLGGPDDRIATVGRVCRRPLWDSTAPWVQSWIGNCPRGSCIRVGWVRLPEERRHA